MSDERWTGCLPGRDGDEVGCAGEGTQEGYRVIRVFTADQTLRPGEGSPPRAVWGSHGR